MRRFLRIALLGFLVWLIPFVVSVLIFELTSSNRALFESIMPVVLTACAVGFSIIYYRKTEAGLLKDALAIGVIWLAISLVLDLFMFMNGPMKMSFSAYMADIGLTYLIIPMITVGMGYSLELSGHRGKK